MELSKEMLTEISYVNISKYRTKVIKTLDGEVKIPTVIAKDSGIRTNHVSKVLSELKAHELIECINPEARKGRLYRLTDKGDELVKNLKLCYIFRYNYLVFKISSFSLLNSLSGITGLPSSLTGLSTLAYLMPLFFLSIWGS